MYINVNICCDWWWFFNAKGLKLNLAQAWMEVVNVMTQPAGQQAAPSINRQFSTCLPLVIPRTSLLLTYQLARKPRSRAIKPGEAEISKAGRENCQTFWKLANPSFSLCQTGAWGSRGLDGAIGNLFHRGIMCIESSVLHNTCTIRLYTESFLTLEVYRKVEWGVDNVYRIPLRVHWYYFKGKLYPMWPCCRLQPPAKA